MVMPFGYFILFLIFLISCNPSDKSNSINSYKKVKWQLLAFEDTTKKFKLGDYLWLDAEFLTQNDSVFWNSHHEGNDKFFIQLKDTLQHPFFFPFYLASEQDSLMIIAPKQIILTDIFNIQTPPYFLQKDKIIKCFAKIKKQINSLNDSCLYQFQKDENKLIQSFLDKNKILHQKDTNGMVWLEPLPIPDFKYNRQNVKEATVAYSGYFLDGRMIDHSDSLGIRYDDTLQLIEGLNFVIKKLDVGQSAKIILPSHLAFGARGSFNKTIPPYTPLLYEIKLIQIK